MQPNEIQNNSSFAYKSAHKTKIKVKIS